MYSVAPALYMELFAQKVYILRVRDCPFPQRINNKNYHNKEPSKRLQRLIFFNIVFAFETRDTSVTDAKCIRRKKKDTNFVVVFVFKAFRHSGS